MLIIGPFHVVQWATNAMDALDAFASAGGPEAAASVVEELLASRRETSLSTHA